MTGSRGAWWSAAILAVSCQARPPPAASTPPGAAARIGDVAISASLVGDAARAAAEPPARALDALVADALAAQGAKAEGLDRGDRFAWESAAVLARHVASLGARRAVEAGAPRDEELEDVRVAHAVVLRSARVSEAQAMSVAEAIRAAGRGAPSADEFEKRALATPHGDAQVVAESLEPFRADGQSTKGGHYDEAFVAAAFGLHTPGELSEVVESPFGWHVLFLVGRSTPDPGELDERRTSLAGAVAELRARAWLQALLRARRRTMPVEVLGVADALMAEVRPP